MPYNARRCRFSVVSPSPPSSWSWWWPSPTPCRGSCGPTCSRASRSSPAWPTISTGCSSTSTSAARACCRLPVDPRAVAERACGGTCGSWPAASCSAPRAGSSRDVVRPAAGLAARSRLLEAGGDGGLLRAGVLRRAVRAVDVQPDLRPRRAALLLRAEPRWVQPWDAPWDWFRQLLVPWMVLAAPLGAMCLRLTLSITREAMDEEFVRTAAGQGPRTERCGPPARGAAVLSGHVLVHRGVRAADHHQHGAGRADAVRARVLQVHVARRRARQPVPRPVPSPTSRCCARSGCGARCC